MHFPSTDIDSDIETHIRKMQENYGVILGEELDAHAFSSFAKQKMLHYKLIVQSEDKPWLYSLTERGWQFESIARENEIADLNKRKLKFDVTNAERINVTYWWTFGFAVAAFAISIVLLILKIKDLADS